MSGCLNGNQVQISLFQQSHLSPTSFSLYVWCGVQTLTYPCKEGDERRETAKWVPPINLVECDVCD